MDEQSTAFDDVLQTLALNCAVSSRKFSRSFDHASSKAHRKTVNALNEQHEFTIFKYTGCLDVCTIFWRPFLFLLHVCEYHRGVRSSPIVPLALSMHIDKKRCDVRSKTRRSPRERASLRVGTTTWNSYFMSCAWLSRISTRKPLQRNRLTTVYLRHVW